MFSKIKTKLMNLGSRVQESLIKNTDLTQITPRIFWMEHPNKDKIERLANYLNQKFNSNYYIWNVGEKVFSTEWFQNQVANHTHPGYPCPSLIEQLTIIKNILIWLSNDDMNIAIITCQESRGRSILTITGLLSFLGAGHPGECLLRVCQLTNTEDFQALFPSQHLYLTYIGNLKNGLKLNNTSLRLVSIVLSTIPQVNNCAKFRPYIQLYNFRSNKAIYDSIDQLNIYEKNESCKFELKGIEISDDILVRCKHFESNDARIALFRFAFNCGFIFENVYRVWARDMDKSSQMNVDSDFFIDFIFERGNQKSQQTSELISQFKVIDKSSNNLVDQIVTECSAIVVRQPKLKEGIQVIFDQQKQQQIDPFSIIPDYEIKHEDDDQHLPNQQDTHEKKIQDDNKQNNLSHEKQIHQQSEKAEQEQLHLIEQEDHDDFIQPKSQTHEEQMVQKFLQNQDEDSDEEDYDDYLNKLEQQFKLKTIQEPIPGYQEDPYYSEDQEYLQNVENALSDKHSVCAIKFDEFKQNYTISSFSNQGDAINSGFIITHQGKCGACSTLQDLAVYLTTDLTRPVRKCGLTHPFNKKNLAKCIQSLGFTDTCTQIWVFNTLFTKKKCFQPCIKSFLINEDFVKPNGDLNNCLQCDEDTSGPIFKYESGRTRRNSGIHSEIDRPNDQIYNMTHCYY